MKKINQTATTGGAPITKEDLRGIFNDEIWDVIEGMLSKFNADTEGVIVSGCVISGGGPYDISAGIVYLDGEFMRFPGATGQTLPKYIAAAAAVNDSRTFADGSTQVVAITKSAELVGSAPGTQYVSITSTTDPDARRLSTLMPSVKEFEIGDWDMDATAFVILNHGLPDHKKIRFVCATIRDDADSSYYDLCSGESDGTLSGWTGPRTSTTVVLNRKTAGQFDAATFNSTSFNRGWVTIFYNT